MSSNNEIRKEDLFAVNESYYKKGESDANKKKKKKKKKEEYDYSDINYDGDIRKMMKELADSIKGYIKYMEVYVIFEGVTEDEWKKNMKVAKKLIKKLKKGDPSVFNIDVLNEMLADDHKLVIGN